MDNIRGKHDILNSLTAAAASGAIYKSTGEQSFPNRLPKSVSHPGSAAYILCLVAGVRPAMISAGLMSAAAGGWSFFKTLV